MFFIIFFVSFFATVLSSMSGAGSSMIIVPTWLFLGYPLPVAIAAINFNGALWTPIAAYNYLNKIKIDWWLIFYLCLFGLFGAYFGANVIADVDSSMLQRIFGVIILVLVCIVYFQKEFGVETFQPRINRFLVGIFAIPLGFYEAFFGSGNGLFTSYVLIKARGLNLSTSLGYYYLIAFTWCFCGSYLLIARGFYDIALILPSSLGSVLGAYLGSKIGRTKGSKFIRLIFLILGAGLGLKLALNF